MDRAENGIITRKLFQNTMLTMLAAELSGALTAVIDGVITGRFLGAMELAAHGIGTPYFSIASIISGILMVGCTALCTRAVGRGDKEETTRVFSLTILLGTVLSVLLALIGTVFAGKLASAFGARGASAALHAETTSYLHGVFIGAPGFILFVILTPILQLDGDSLRPKLASAVMAVVDVAGDLLNVFVLHGGMFGMGLASSISHYAALIVLLTHFLRGSSLFRFSLHGIQLKMAPMLMRDGLPRAASMLCRGLLPIFLNSLALKLAGDLGVTAFSAMNSTTFVIGSLGWAIGGAVLIMGGMTVGEQDVHGLENVVRTALYDILIWVVLIAVIVLTAAPLLAVLFIPDEPDACAMAVTAIRCYAAALPFLAFNVSGANYFQAISRIKAAYLVNICIEFACTACMAFILQVFFGITGLWLAFPIGQGLLCFVIILCAVLRRSADREGLAACMMLPADFGVPDKDCIERSIHSMEEVVAMSVDVGAFCAAHAFGKKESSRLALCIEEMAGNVIEHGFSDGKPHHLDVRVLVKNEQIVLRLRDDCRLFDLSKKVKDWSFDPEHPEHNIGIRMVMHAAKDIAYTNTMNMNNLIVKI